LVENVKRSLSS